MSEVAIIHDTDAPHGKTEFAWLIEAAGPFYLGVRKLGTSEGFYWTNDAGQALRFYNREQANNAMFAVRELNRDLFKFPTPTEARPVEHGWL